MRTIDTRVSPPEAVTYSEQGVGHGKIRKMNSRRRLVLLALVLVVIAAAVIAAVATTRGSKKSPQAAPTTSHSVTASVPPTTSARASSPAPALPTTPPTSAPAGVTWALFHGVALPTSATDGPTMVRGPVYAGYSHTPTGALLAASQIITRYLITPGDGWRQVVADQLVPGPARDAYVKVRSSVTTVTPPAAGYAQTAGFRFLSYTADVAAISLADRQPNGTYAAVYLTVRWVDNDWKLDLPANTAGQQTPLATLSGYVIWQGVS